MIYVILIISSAVFFVYGFYVGYSLGAKDGMLYAIQNMIIRTLDKDGKISNEDTTNKT